MYFLDFQEELHRTSFSIRYRARPFQPVMQLAEPLSHFFFRQPRCASRSFRASRRYDVGEKALLKVCCKAMTEEVNILIPNHSNYLIDMSGKEMSCMLPKVLERLRTRVQRNNRQACTVSQCKYMSYTFSRWFLKSVQ